MILLMPLTGATIGAASGSLGGALADVGINNRFMRDAAESLQSGNAALFLLVRKMATDKVLAALQSQGGTVIRPPSTRVRRRLCARRSQALHRPLRHPGLGGEPQLRKAQYEDPGVRCPFWYSYTAPLLLRICRRFENAQD
jgi:hypothetical protein